MVFKPILIQIISHLMDGVAFLIPYTMIKKICHISNQHNVKTVKFKQDNTVIYLHFVING